MSFTRKGHHTGAAYSSISLTRDLYSKENSFTLLDPSKPLMTPRTLLALLTSSWIWSLHDRLYDIVIPRSLIFFTLFRISPFGSTVELYFDLSCLCEENPKLSRACIGHVTPLLLHESSRKKRHSTFDRCRPARVAWALFQDPQHRVFFWVLHNGGCANYYSAFIISHNLSVRTSLCWTSVLRKNVTALVLLTLKGNVNKRLKCLKLCSKNFDEIWENSHLNNEYKLYKGVCDAIKFHMSGFFT